jgi:membrane protein DedA with SNARE-associated domain
MEHFLTHPVASHGYLAVLVLMAISSACVPIPSEIVMLFGGALASATFAAAQHPPVARLSFVAVSLVGVAGSLIGSWAAYALGYAGGRPLVERWGRYLLIRPHEVDRAEAWFDRHGEAAVFWTRLVPLARAFISLPAGVTRMPFWRFTAYTILGVLPWCFGLAGAGYALGGNWHTIVHWFLPVSIVVAVILVGWLALWLRRRIRARRAPVPS